MRLAFTELGTTFIKLGQVLSTRPDLVGPEVAQELAYFQAAAPADDPDKIRATIESEFGKAPGELSTRLQGCASWTKADFWVGTVWTGTSSSKPPSY